MCCFHVKLLSEQGRPYVGPADTALTWEPAPVLLMVRAGAFPFGMLQMCPHSCHVLPTNSTVGAVGSHCSYYFTASSLDLENTIFQSRSSFSEDI